MFNLIIETNKLKKYFFLIFILFSIGCKSNIELAMERGIQYYKWDKIEEAVLEFKYVIHTLSKQNNSLDYNQIKLLSRAHHNLSIAYAKKEWYDYAVKEARQAFELIPTDDNRKVMELIQKKMLGKSKASSK